MKVLTLHQPWATLVAVGAKTIETRSQPTYLRERIAIHAAALSTHRRCDLICRVGPYEVTAPDRPGAPWRLYDEHRHAGFWGLAFGSIVATAVVVECLPIIDWGRCSYHSPPHLCVPPPGGRLLHHLPIPAEPTGPTEFDVTDQMPLGDYRPGRFAWLLDDVERLPIPIPFRGGQGWSRTWEPT